MPDTQLTGFADASTPFDSSQIRSFRDSIKSLRRRTAERLDEGMSGTLVAAAFAEGVHRFLASRMDDSLAPLHEQIVRRLYRETALIAVGGTGRSLMCPHSDVDLMLLSRTSDPEFEAAAATFVQAIWDSGLKLGHSVRTVEEAIALGLEDAKTATSFVETRLVWGSDRVHEAFSSQVKRRLVERRKAAFVASCIRARRTDWPHGQSAVQTLEPNLKVGLGGLRDLHLIRWVAFAEYGTNDQDVLLLQRNITADEAVCLQDAEDFLLRVRSRMHLLCDGPQEVLRRDLQTQIASAEQFTGSSTQRPVEQFMREYFRHSGNVADISRRFVARFEPTPIRRQLAEAIAVRRRPGGLLVGRNTVNAAASTAERVIPDLRTALHCYELSVEGQGRRIMPRLEA